MVNGVGNVNHTISDWKGKVSESTVTCADCTEVVTNTWGFTVLEQIRNALNKLDDHAALSPCCKMFVQ